MMVGPLGWWLGRRNLGIDLNPDYHDIAKQRMVRLMQQLGLCIDDDPTGEGRVDRCS